MRKYQVPVFFCILILLSFIAGCTSTNSPGTVVATTPFPATGVTTPTEVSGTVITAIPSTELARIQQDLLGVASGTGSLYQFKGKLTTDGGTYKSVRVIMRYPDGQQYVFDAGNMGGASPTVKSFALFPDSSYQGQVAKYFIRLDGNEYATVYQYTDGTIYRIATSDSAVPVSSP
jgi:hypothetical protein